MFSDVVYAQTEHLNSPEHATVAIKHFIALINLNQFPQEMRDLPQTWQVAFAVPLSPVSLHQPERERESLTGIQGWQTGSESTAEQAQCNQRRRGVITKVFTRRCPTEIPSHILGSAHLRSTHKNTGIST